MPPYTGKKRGGNHSSLITDAVPVVSFAQSLAIVSKISPGIIRVGGNRQKTSVKVRSLSGCLLLTIHGSSAVQEIRLYTRDQTTLQQLLESRFAKP